MSEVRAETPGTDDGESAEDFSRLLGASLKEAEKTFSAGDRVRGTVLVVGKEDVIVAIGPAKDGLVAKGEFVDAEGRCALKAGDSLELFVTLVRPGEVRLSKNPTDKNVTEDLKEAYDNRLSVEGRVVELCKGGLRVNLKGKTAFCPISQIDLKRTETGAEFVGQRFDFRITQFSEGGGNVVVSRRKLLEEDQSRAAAAFLEKSNAGDVLSGTVARLEKFGAFVELVPGVDGLVHVSEIAWSRIESPGDVLSVGQAVVVKILKQETVEGRLKISLSIKQASDRPAAPDVPRSEDPWSKFAAGQVVAGKVTRKEVYGVFVELEPGITGLLHKSRTEDRPEFQFERLRVGHPLSVRIAEIKLSERRIGLELAPDPSEGDWKDHQPAAETSMGSLGEQLKAALAKKQS